MLDFPHHHTKYKHLLNCGVQQEKQKVKSKIMLNERNGEEVRQVQSAEQASMSIIPPRQQQQNNFVAMT